MRLRGAVDHGLVPEDAIVTRLSVREGLSELFDLEAELRTGDPDVDLDGMIWSSAAFRIDDLEGESEPRVFHGIIEEAEYLRASGDRYVYRLRARPLVHGLSYRVRSRILQGKDEKGLDAVEAIKTVLKDAGIADDALCWKNLTGKYPIRELCVQYKESELAFVMRLLEHEGIFFSFEHSEDRHVMAFGDQTTFYRPIAGATSLGFSKWAQADREGVSELVFHSSLRHDAFTARDWDFESPERPLEAEQSESEGSVFERYEYPGGFAPHDDGAHLALLRYQEGALEKYVLEGSSTCRRLAPGRLFSVAGAKPAFLCAEYVLLGVEHLFEDLGGCDEASSERPRYEARFRAVGKGTLFRPPRVTPRPRVFGKESAVVTGPSGEEIHVDDLGRIKVHFYWDREGKIDDKASCWIRVQQQNTRGSMLLPRVGWELDIGFLDGDPDRPVALQKLYNRETMPPYLLPADITQAALQSSTSPGGSGTNEIKLQDQSGGMDFFVHASRDLGVDCNHDLAEKIKVDSKEEVGLTLSTSVVSDEEITVKGNQSTSVTKDFVEETGKAKTEKVGAMDDWGVTKQFTVITHGARKEKVLGLMNVLANDVGETFGATCERSVGGAFAINSGKSIVEAVAGRKTELVGAAKMELIKGAKSERVALAKALTAGKVTEKTGKDVQIQADGAIGIKAGKITEQCDGDFTVGARKITLTAKGGVLFKVGGTTFELKGDTLHLKASSLGADGGQKAILTGKKLTYKEP